MDNNKPISQLTWSVGVAAVLTVSPPAVATRHYFAGADAPGSLAGRTVFTQITLFL